MSHYTTIYKNGEHKRDILGLFVFNESSFLYFGGVFNKTIIPLALVGYELIIANSALRASFAIYSTNRFHVVVRLFSNRSQITSKCGKNKKVAHEA